MDIQIGGSGGSGLPNWVVILSALATPTLAVAGVILTFLNYRFSWRKRKDELFDRRYAFYQKVRASWLRTTDEGQGEGPMIPEFEDLYPQAEEALLLFGQDIQTTFLVLLEHIMTAIPIFQMMIFPSHF